MAGFELGMLVGLVWSVLVVVTVALVSGGSRADRGRMAPGGARAQHTAKYDRSQGVWARDLYGFTDREWELVRRHFPNWPQYD